MVKKLLIKVLVAVLLLSMILTFASCSETQTTTPSTTPSTSSGGNNNNDPSKFPSQLENIKTEIAAEFAGADPSVQFFYIEGGSGTYTGDSLWADPDGLFLDDVANAVINRNGRVEEDLGITLPAPEELTGGIADMQSLTKTYFDTQDPTLDVYCGYQYFDISLAASKDGAMLLNLNNIVNNNGQKIINIENDYWATNYINTITYNNNMYWVTGALSLRYLGGLYCTFVNTDIYDASCKATFGNRTIYQVVEDGDWTMENMLKMAAAAWEGHDSDGSGAASSDDEQIGIVYELNDSFDGLAFGCKVDFSKKSIDPSTGKETIEITLTDSNRGKRLADYINTLFEDKCNLMVDSNDSDNMMNQFAAGNVLFAVNKIYQASVYLSDMENFAIIPTPLLDKDQKDTAGKPSYGSGVHDGVTIFGISKYSDCPKASAAALELLAYYSDDNENSMANVFYDKVMKGSRVSRNDMDAVMIDKIRDGFDSDFAGAWGNSINNIIHCYRDKNNVKKYAFFLNQQKRKWPTLLNELLAQLDNNALPE